VGVGEDQDVHPASLAAPVRTRTALAHARSGGPNRLRLLRGWGIMRTRFVG
jgi:hypothetical protein